ncbi:hypothetical protein L596_024731 [Steinernema carpocapsae]|uniref:Uncharacterized protein n=1 Tax=Steinernema carpocapsae TaxID=34508 RepID=A0A4U5M5K9_STECR|nr:hypothetical protein L596_024731 [Steinernema carpocapsae]
MNVGPHERRIHGGGGRNVDVFTLDTDRKPYGTHTREVVHRKKITQAYYCDEPEPDYNPNETYTFNPTEAVDRISDEFRFLDDKQSNCQKYLFVFVAITQVIVAIGMIIFAALRYRKLFYTSTKSTTLLDLVKAEDYASNNREGAAILAVKSGTAVLVPAFLQILSGLCGLWPLVDRRPSFLQILQILFGSIAIILWIEPLTIMSMEVNLEYIQIRKSTDTSYGLLIAVITILAFDVLLVNMILVAITASETLFEKPFERSKILVVWNMLISSVALVTLIISVIALTSSTTNVMTWKQPTTNETALYQLGLREGLISSLILFSSCYGLYSACLDPAHRFGAAVLSTISLLATIKYIFSSDRILSITHNIRVLSAVTNAYPINWIMLLMLYSLLLFLFFALIVVIAITFAVHFPAVKPDFSVGPPAPPGRLLPPSSFNDRSQLHQRTHFPGSRL